MDFEKRVKVVRAAMGESGREFRSEKRRQVVPAAFVFSIWSVVRQKLAALLPKPSALVPPPMAVPMLLNLPSIASASWSFNSMS